MANNFKVWVEVPTPGQQVQASSVFALDPERINGFEAGNPASALRVNSGLRQANLVCAALMQMCDDVVTLPAELSLVSAVTTTKNAIRAAFNKLNSDTLTSAKSYSDTTLTSAKAYTDSKVNEAKSDVTTLATRVTKAETRINANTLSIGTTLDLVNKNISDISKVSAKVTSLEKYNKKSIITINVNSWSANTSTAYSNAKYVYIVTPALSDIYHAQFKTSLNPALSVALEYVIENLNQMRVYSDVKTGVTMTVYGVAA